MAVNFVPQGFHSVTPYLFIKGAAKAIDYYKDVFGATVLVKMLGPDGVSIAHAEIRIGDSIIMLGDEVPQLGALSPLTIGGTASGLNVYLPSVDRRGGGKGRSRGREARTPGAGPVLRRPQRHADRSLRPHVVGGHAYRDVAPEEMKRRMAAMSSQAAGA